MIDTTSPPDKITKHTKEWLKYVKGEGEGVTEKSVSSFELWDFAGQPLYYASHPVFLTSRAIYISWYATSVSHCTTLLNHV